MKDLKINLTGKRPQRGCGHPHNRGPIYWAPGMGEKQGPCWTPGRGVLTGCWFEAGGDTWRGLQPGLSFTEPETPRPPLLDLDYTYTSDSCIPFPFLPVPPRSLEPLQAPSSRACSLLV